MSPVIPSSAYVSVESVTNLIRAVANDMIYSQVGEILTDTANFMMPYLNDALEWFQNEVNNHGVTTFEKETFLTGITPAAFTPANDPGQQVNISDTGYFDGTNNHGLPVIPFDLLEPLKLWERQNGSSDNWCPMRFIPGGLPSQTPTDRFGMWDWRTDSIYMPGAIQTNDLRLRYTGSSTQFSTVNDTLFFRGATGAMAYKVVGTYLMSKNPDAADKAFGEAKLRVAQITMRSLRSQQSQSVSRISYGNRSGRSNFRPPHN